MEKSHKGICPTRRIRLLWLIDSLNMGGAERLVSSFARNFDKNLFEFRVVCLKVIGGNPIAAEIEAIGVPVTILGARNLRDVKAFLKLIRLIRNSKIDLIHTHLTYADIWGRLAGLLTWRPVVSTVHVPTYIDYSNTRPRRDKMIEALATFTRKHLGQTVIAVSEALRRHHTSGGFPSERIVTIHNGIELSEFKLNQDFSRADRRAELGIPPDAPVVITLAVLREGKGHYILISAAERVIKKFPEVRFLIVGGGPLENKLRETVKDLGFSDRIIFTGMRQDAVEMLALGDLFVSPSLLDPLPTVVLEAMAMKLPVVAFDSGGVPEMVVDSQTGLLVPLATPEDLADAIFELLTNPHQAKHMGELGHARVKSEFSAQGWVYRLQDLYYRFLIKQRIEGRKQRKIYVVEFLGKGGMIHYVYQLCSALSDQAVDVKLITAQDYELNDRPHNFAVERMFRLWNPKPSGQVDWSVSLTSRWSYSWRRVKRGLMYYRAWWQLIRYLSRERPDVVQLGEIRFATDLVPLLLLRLIGLRLADICHNIAPFDTRPDSDLLVKNSLPYRIIYRLIYKCFFAIFVHGESNRREFLHLYGVNENRIYVIPHGNEQLFIHSAMPGSQNSTLRRRLNIPVNSMVVLFFGTLAKYKGVEFLLDAFAIVKRKLPLAHLIVAGYPNPDVNIDALYCKADKLGISESVVFHLQYIPNEEVAAFFKLAKVAVFPYLMIYQSGSLQLAYSFGKPVVATRVGGLSEDVKHGETGLLVPLHDSDALAEALTKLLSDPKLARRLGRRARELSETFNSWNLIAHKVRQIYFATSLAVGEIDGN